ncbi:hypothetical protein OG749_01245 [Streptomyces nojiriensis]|uniref:hypothetical protein n=1 Tax=Streptomyces nojiriensis TaxID=66374 RepID=UPI002E19236B
MSLAAVVLPDHVQIDDDGHIHLGAPAPKPFPSTAAPTPESTSPPLTRDALVPAGEQRGKTQAPSTTSALTDSQTYLTLTELQLNLSDIPLPEVTVRIG